MSGRVTCTARISSLPCAGNTGKNAAIVLQSCASAVAAGDARDLFRLLTDGQLQNAAGEKCVGVLGDNVAGGSLVLSECDGNSRWEMLGNGQLKLNAPGDLCLSQKGLAPGKANVASNAAAMSSSTANVWAHGTPHHLSHPVASAGFRCLQVRQWLWTKIWAHSGLLSSTPLKIQSNS